MANEAHERQVSARGRSWINRFQRPCRISKVDQVFQGLIILGVGVIKVKHGVRMIDLEYVDPFNFRGAHHAVLPLPNAHYTLQANDPMAFPLIHDLCTSLNTHICQL
jgi:hypothetical protein